MIQVTAAIIKQNDKYLICQRKADDNGEMLWEFPGGKLEAGETLEECIIRKIKEELSIDITVKDIFAKTVYNHASKELHFTFFNCDIVSGEIQITVHNTFEWVTCKEMKEYKFMPADVEIVALLNN